MSSRAWIVVASLSIVVGGACGQRKTEQQAATGSGAGSVVTAIDAAPAPPAIDASLYDGTLQLVGIDVLTPPKEFQARAAAAGAKPMEPLVVAAKAAVAAVDGARAGELGDAVVVWIAVRPGRKVRAWVALPGKTDGDAARAEVADRMKTAPAPEVTDQVSFAVTFDRSGRRPRGPDIPVPPELEAGRATAGAQPDDLIAHAWKK